MTYTNSTMATSQILSPHCYRQRKGPIKGVAIHCTAGSANHTAEQIAAVFQGERKASCNYAIGGDGSVCLVVPEMSRSFCTSSADVDEYAVTIEVASDRTGLVVKDDAVKALIRLLADICIRNDIKELKWTGKKDDACKWDVNNMQVHRWYSSKACPGSYLFGLHPRLAMEANRLIKQGKVEINMTEDQIRAIAEKVFTAKMAYLEDSQIDTLMARIRIREKQASLPGWAKESWRKAEKMGLLDGSRPEGSLKRDELAAVLDRLNLLSEEE